MAGIIFLKTIDLPKITEFYLSIGAKIWLQQKNVNILQHDNMLFGFHEQDENDIDVLLTFFYKNKSDVDKMYSLLQALALNPPKENMTYKIYNFFAKDPENRLIEFQYFLHEIDYSWDD